MPILLGILGLMLGVMIWVWRAHYTVRAIKELDRDTKQFRRNAHVGFEDVFGSRLSRIRDPRFAAAVLMIQLVRTGAPVTAAEKKKILGVLEHQLDVQTPEAMYERAWRYTEYRKPFSRSADETLGLFRRQLTPDERLQLVDMLTAVANAYGDASDLQLEAIERLKRRLMRDPSGHDQSASGDFKE